MDAPTYIIYGEKRWPERRGTDTAAVMLAIDMAAAGDFAHPITIDHPEYGKLVVDVRRVQ